MACKEYEAQLEDYLNGELAAPEASGEWQNVEAHLSACVRCRESLEAARQAGELLRAGLEPAGEPGPAFWTRVAASIRAEEERRRQFWGSIEILARRLSWSAALAVALMTAYLVKVDVFSAPGGRASGADARQGMAQTEVREIFPEPVQQPSSPEEVLLTLAGGGNGR